MADNVELTFPENGLRLEPGESLDKLDMKVDGRKIGTIYFALESTKEDIGELPANLVCLLMQVLQGDWRFAGSVGVDSGQLCIMDPCYDTRQGDDSPALAVKFWGQGEAYVAQELTARGIPVVPMRDGAGEVVMTKELIRILLGKEVDTNTPIQEEVWDKLMMEVSRKIHGIAREHNPPLVVMAGERRASFYDECSQITTESEYSHGPVHYAMGHEGMAVVASTLSGDGYYPVLVKLEHRQDKEGKDHTMPSAMLVDTSMVGSDQEDRKIVL